MRNNETISHDELCLEEDGDIGMDWMTPDRDFLIMSLRDNGRIAFAVLLDDGRSVSGNTYIAPEEFEVLRKLVNNAVLRGAEGVQLENTVRGENPGNDEQ